MRTPEVQLQTKVRVKEQISPKAELIKARGGVVMTEMSGKPQKVFDLTREKISMTSLATDKNPISAKISVGGCDNSDHSRCDYCK